MARERYSNGYKGRGGTRRQMHANFRGFADHSARSLKPVHGRAGRGVGSKTNTTSLVRFLASDW